MTNIKLEDVLNVDKNYLGETKAAIERMLSVTVELQGLKNMEALTTAQDFFNSKDFKLHFIPLLEIKKSDWKKDIIYQTDWLEETSRALMFEYKNKILGQRFLACSDHLIRQIEDILLLYLGWLAVIVEAGDYSHTYERRKRSSFVGRDEAERIIGFTETISTICYWNVSESKIKCRCKLIDPFVDIDGTTWDNHIIDMLGANRRNVKIEKLRNNWVNIEVDMLLDDEAMDAFEIHRIQRGI